MSDWESLLSAAQKGDEMAWSELYRDLTPPVRGYLRSLSAADPGNLIGEVWLSVSRKIGTFHGNRKSFRSWVFVVAHHRVIDERRQRSRRPLVLVDKDELTSLQEPGASPEQAVIEKMSTAAALAALSVLTDDQRAVLGLRIIGQLSLTETAQALGKEIGAVKALQYRALEALRKKYGNTVSS